MEVPKAVSKKSALPKYVRISGQAEANPLA